MNKTKKEQHKSEDLGFKAFSELRPRTAFRKQGATCVTGFHAEKTFLQYETEGWEEWGGRLYLAGFW